MPSWSNNASGSSFYSDFLNRAPGVGVTHSRPDMRIGWCRVVIAQRGTESRIGVGDLENRLQLLPITLAQSAKTVRIRTLFSRPASDAAAIKPEYSDRLTISLKNDSIFETGEDTQISLPAGLASNDELNELRDFRSVSDAIFRSSRNVSRDFDLLNLCGCRQGNSSRWQSDRQQTSAAPDTDY